MLDVFSLSVKLSTTWLLLTYGSMWYNRSSCPTCFSRSALLSKSHPDKVSVAPYLCGVGEAVVDMDLSPSTCLLNPFATLFTYSIHSCERRLPRPPYSHVPANLLVSPSRRPTVCSFRRHARQALVALSGDLHSNLEELVLVTRPRPRSAMQM